MAKKHPNEKHGLSRSPTYAVWNSMVQRCRNSNHRAYKYYGGRGIDVCEEWTKFDGFLKDMGEKPPNMSLDRINNSDGYYPENCRWTTMKNQNRNRRNNICVTFNGCVQTIVEWSEELGINDQTLYSRYRVGDRPPKLFRDP